MLAYLLGVEGDGTSVSMAESISLVEVVACMCLLMGDRRREEGVLRARSKGGAGRGGTIRGLGEGEGGAGGGGDNANEMCAQ